MSLDDFVRAAQEGSDQAFERLVEIYQRKLFHFIKKFTDEIFIEDIVQESFIAAFGNINKLKNPKFFGTWLFSIAKRKAYCYHNEKKIVIENETYTNVSNNYEEKVNIAIEKLNKKQQNVIKLKYFSHLSLSEISIVEQIDEKTVKSRLFEARKLLKTLIPKIMRNWDVEQDYFQKNKEQIMTIINEMKDYAKIIERLSLHSQLQIVNSVKNSEKFPQELLSEIIKIESGKEFLNHIEIKLSVKEFSEIMDFVDSFTRNRIMKEVEQNDREFFSILEDKFFTFEDLINFDKKMLKLLFNSFSSNEVAMACKGVTIKLRDYIFDVFSEERQNEINNEFKELGPVQLKLVEENQRKILSKCNKVAPGVYLVTSQNEDGEFIMATSQGYSGKAKIDENMKVETNWSKI